MNAPRPDMSLIGPEHIERARDAAARASRHVVDALAEATGIEPRQVVARLADMFGLPVIETPAMLDLDEAFDRLPLARAMQRQVAVLRTPEGAYVTVISDPFDLDTQTWLGSLCGPQAEFRLALAGDIHAYLAKHEGTVRAVDSVQTVAGDASGHGRAVEVLSFAAISDTSSPAVRVVSSTLYDAMKARASDVHLESTASGLTVKYRIDGVLDHTTDITGLDLAEQVISRLKVLAELDIAERRVPQDGSFTVQVQVEDRRRDIDLRVSIMPSVFGEDAVIRILDKEAVIAAYGSLRLEALGFNQATIRELRDLASQPYGMLLVTGPTGSGKTTTMYAALSEINNGRDKIITIEDPVEYQLPGVLQIPVNDKKGLTFAVGLRSILRHDPDKIMVGEIRDRETAEIAVQSALTGHLVLTTVHANNVFDVFGRFKHMGIDPYSFVSALNGIGAQRLIRTVCPHCAVEHVPTAEELDRLRLNEQDLAGASLRIGRGCGDCRSTGYKGRRAIAELLRLNDELRQLVIDQAPIGEIKAAAKRHGTRPLRETALALVHSGTTTLEEMGRVTLNG
jgi:general secretion pathway protein E